MAIDPAAGKILGMLMAYAVSSLGLLLAYINYRKRIVKAETVFTPISRTVLITVVTVAVVGAVVTGAAATGKHESLWLALKGNWLGLWMPALIVLVSVALTWMLYTHFARRLSSRPTDGAGDPSDP